jgi:hypothetical protein
MADKKYGQVGWDEGNVSTGTDFMNLEQGDNLVRVFTNPYQFIVHWVKDSSGATKKVKCAVEDCPLCKRGIKAQYRWFLGVIDRKSGEPKLLEISSQVYIGIKNHVSEPAWGDVKMYDVNIKRGPKGAQPLYTVMGIPDKRPLNADEQALVDDFNERVEVTKFTQPSTPEEIAEKLGTSVAPTNAPVQYAVGTQTVTNDGESVRPTVSEDDFNFADDDL